LFVNWKDNWLAHHLTDGSTWGPWPTEEEMDSWGLTISHTLNQYGFKVQFAGDIPENLSSYDLVVIHAYWAVEPKHQSIIRDYILNGGSVVLLYGVPTYFLVYCKDWWPLDRNLSPIQEWFGSWQYATTEGYANVTVDNPFGTELLKGDTLIEEYGHTAAAVTKMHNDTQIVAEWGNGLTFAFTHEYGMGRIYYQSSVDMRTSVLGDVNGDGTVNLSDLIAAANTFGAIPSSSVWNPQADVFPDGVVNISDFVKIAQHFGQHI
jgi:hypothetical protein